MSWLGKFFGGAFGFMLGGPLGAILGASVGHQFDVGRDALEHRQDGFMPGDQHRVQMAFFTATFSVMGHIAKADGRVSKAEINLARRVMDEMGLTGEMRETAVKLFQQGKNPGFPLDEAIFQLRKECQRRTQLLRMFLEIQLQAALADGAIDASEEKLLRHICSQLGVSRFEYERIKLQILAQQRFYAYGQQQHEVRRQSGLRDAYQVLGLDETASDAEVKTAYRRLISQNHPDKLVAKGLPEEMMKIAKEKTQQIRKAYELVRASRNKKL